MVAWMSRSFICLTLCAGLVSAWTTDDCPHPCRCLDKGKVYCNGSHLELIPNNLPPDTVLLELSDNKIGFIPQDAFRRLPKLATLNLESNGLNETSFSRGALEWTHITTLDLSNNNFTDAPPSVPKSLRTLYFFNNKLTKVGAGFFQKFQSLRYFDLSNNRITRIDPHAFSPLKSINSINISFNKIADAGLTAGMFEMLESLITISMRFNQLTKIPTQLPTSLQNLDLVGNQITVLPSRIFENLIQLKTLALWNGQVSTIEDFAFAGLGQLTILDMMQNKVSSKITNDTFYGLTGLKTVYLDLNSIPTIQDGALQHTHNLNSLWMADNQLSHLSPGVLDESFTSNLSEVYIDGNPWYCDCHLRWLREKADNATYSIMSPHLIVCSGPKIVAGKPWDRLKPVDFVC